MEDEDDDYMSDKFISSVCDKPPGLTTVRSIQRQRCAEANSKKGRTLSRAEEEAKRRAEGLEKKVEATNKGFSMLLKMGYDPGKGLGKHAEGRAEPVPIEVRTDRGGLGRDTIERERQRTVQRIQQQVKLAERNQFLNMMSTKFRLSRAKRQLEAARKICFQLDTAQLIEVPVSPTFWPAPEHPQSSTSVDSKPTPRYRTKHVGRHRPRSPRPHEIRDRSPFYDDRDQVPQLSDEEELTSLNADKLRTLEDDPVAILQEVVAYLRGRHFYCFWCSAQYDGHIELNNECPGPNEEDHS